MKKQTTIKRTSSDDPDFQQLVRKLDNELWDELKEDQATYDQYNKVPGIQTAVVIYADEKPVACGCFKKYDSDTVEVKRMFVEKEYRGKGLSKLLLIELEGWAAETGFQYAILETSIHFKAARSLYTNAGYTVIENYDQYKGLEESVCMKKELIAGPSEFKNLSGIEYFNFEEDFVEQNVRCIPMIVRFKMDAAGIKLKLAEWAKFRPEEKIELAVRNCATESEIEEYKSYLRQLVLTRAGHEATVMTIDNQPGWANTEQVPGPVQQRAKEFDWNIAAQQWQSLTDLQRFALMKLCRSGHENKNFPKAMKEFKLVVS